MQRIVSFQRTAENLVELRAIVLRFLRSPWGEGGRMEAEARGDTGFERDDNETFRGDVRVEFVSAMVSRLLLADFCWKRVDLGDRDSEIS